MKNVFSYFCMAVVLSLSGWAQDVNPNSLDMAGMSGMDHEPETESLINIFEQHASSGTDIEPISTPSAMLMHVHGSWTFMFHGEAFLNELQQTGPRGSDKFFSTNWFMPMAQRKSGKELLTLRSMLSLEPATVSDRRYPELFQQG